MLRNSTSHCGYMSARVLDLVDVHRVTCDESRQRGGHVFVYAFELYRRDHRVYEACYRAQQVVADVWLCRMGLRDVYFFLTKSTPYCIGSIDGTLYRREALGLDRGGASFTHTNNSNKHL